MFSSSIWTSSGLEIEGFGFCGDHIRLWPTQLLRVVHRNDQVSSNVLHTKHWLCPWFSEFLSESTGPKFSHAKFSMVLNKWDVMSGYWCIVHLMLCNWLICITSYLINRQVNFTQNVMITLLPMALAHRRRRHEVRFWKRDSRKIVHARCPLTFGGTEYFFFLELSSSISQVNGNWPNVCKHWPYSDDIFPFWRPGMSEQTDIKQPNLFPFPIRSMLRPDFTGIVGRNVALKIVLRPLWKTVFIGCHLPNRHL